MQHLPNLLIDWRSILQKVGKIGVTSELNGSVPGQRKHELEHDPNSGKVYGDIG